VVQLIEDYAAESAAPVHTGTAVAEAVEAARLIVEYLTALLDRKRAVPREDLVTDLVLAADRDVALTRQESSPRSSN
jgi:cytochrome P450